MSAAEFHERRPTFKALKYTGQSLDEIATELEVTVRSTRGPMMLGDSVEIWTEPDDWKQAVIGGRHWIVVGRSGVEVLDDREFEKRFELADAYRQRYIIGFDAAGSPESAALLAEVDALIPTHHDLRR